MKKEKREINYWKLTGIILIFIVVLLLGKSLICNEQKIPTQIGKIDTLALEQIKNLTTQYEYVLVVNIDTNERMLLKGEVGK